MIRYIYKGLEDNDFVPRFFRLLQMSTMLVVFLIFNGCDHFVDVELPPTKLTSTAVFNDKQTATAAMSEIYYQLRSTGILTGRSSGISLKLGLYADELDYYEAEGTGSADFYNNSVLPTASDVSTFWKTAYTQIYACNAVIEGVDGTTAILEADKNQLKGEALFVRSLLHFYLENMYGTVPYIATTDYRANSVVGKMGRVEFYNHLIVDLELSAALLTPEYITEDRVRANSYCAKTLLARVFLYNGNWAEASNMASAVLNETQLYSLGALEDTFDKNSTSTILQLMSPSDGINTDEAATFTFVEAPPYFVALTSGLMTAFEVGDLRKSNWTQAVTDGSNIFYHAFKYKKNQNTGSSVEYPIIFRLADLYLIRSEARAQQGELTGAKDDLNIIRNHAGLGNTTAMTQSDLLFALLKERRVEFFTEYGARFFDLKRTGKLDEALLGVKLGWNNSDKLLPLPESELLLNPKLLPQNDGY